MKKVFVCLVCCLLSFSVLARTLKRKSSKTTKTTTVQYQTPTEAECNVDIDYCFDNYCFDKKTLQDGTRSVCGTEPATSIIQKMDSCLATRSVIKQRDFTSGCKSYIYDRVVSLLSSKGNVEKGLAKNTKQCAKATKALQAAKNCYTAMISSDGSISLELYEKLNSLCGFAVSGDSYMLNRFYQAGDYGDSDVRTIYDLKLTGQNTMKRENWRQIVDATLAGYTEIAELACGEEDFKITKVNQYALDSRDNTQMIALKEGAKEIGKQTADRIVNSWFRESDCINSPLPEGGAYWEYTPNGNPDCKIVCQSGYAIGKNSSVCSKINENKWVSDFQGLNVATNWIAENTERPLLPEVVDETEESAETEEKKIKQEEKRIDAEQADYASDNCPPSADIEKRLLSDPIVLTNEQIDDPRLMCAIFFDSCDIGKRTGSLFCSVGSGESYITDDDWSNIRSEKKDEEHLYTGLNVEYKYYWKGLTKQKIKSMINSENNIMGRGVSWGNIETDPKFRNTISYDLYKYCFEQSDCGRTISNSDCSEMFDAIKSSTFANKVFRKLFKTNNGYSYIHVDGKPKPVKLPYFNTAGFSEESTNMKYNALGIKAKKYLDKYSFNGKNWLDGGADIVTDIPLDLLLWQKEVYLKSICPNKESISNVSVIQPDKDYCSDVQLEKVVPVSCPAGERAFVGWVDYYNDFKNIIQNCFNSSSLAELRSALENYSNNTNRKCVPIPDTVVNCVKKDICKKPI